MLSLWMCVPDYSQLCFQVLGPFMFRGSASHKIVTSQRLNESFRLHSLYSSVKMIDYQNAPDDTVE